MGRHRLLLVLSTGFVIIAAVVVLDAAPAIACTAPDKWLGECSVEGSVAPDQVLLEGSTISNERDRRSEAGAGTPGREGTDEGAAEPVPLVPAQRASDFCSPANPEFGDCAGDPSVPPQEQEEPAAPVVVTLRDIASFRPATPGNGMEPGGWAIEGLPANFVAAASVEVVSGTLLGQPADVRFTPVGYRWVHSDGAAVESGTPGATWATLGQREFTPTSTSHVYATAGEYTVELAVVLRAEYRFGGSPWRSIAGTLTIAGEPQRVLVGEVDTVLTQGDCNANPSGPGC
jgi:hypothetical protein